jgi:TPR repeat protein
MKARFTIFSLMLCTAGLTAGCIPIPLLPSGEVHETENDVDELLDNNASRGDVIESLGIPTRQHESAISYLVCRKAVGIGYIICLPYQCAGGDLRGTECFELILEFDDNYRLAGYKKLSFESDFKTPAGSIWETTYPKILREQSNYGDVESQFNLYLIEKENPENIKRLCHLAGRMGHTKAQMEIARLYWRRNDIDDNRSKSYMWYRIAATKDYSEGPYKDEPTQKSAMVEAEYKRQKVLTPDQLRIATQLQLQSFWKPEHCERDLVLDKEQALKILQKRAIQGESHAQWELYKRSKSRGEHDFKWLCKAADQGNYRARGELGYLHHYGLYGVRKDLVLSAMWYGLVESGGPNPKGVNNIHKQLKLTPEQLIEVKRLYLNWKPGHCEREIFGTEPNNTN